MERVPCCCNFKKLRSGPILLLPVLRNCARSCSTCSTADRADGSAEVASEIVKHLKKLTQRVRELESTISATDVQPSSTHADGSTVRSRIENSSGSRLGCRKGDKGATPESDQVYYTMPQDLISGLPNNYPMSPTCTIDNGQWITWKWRWAASGARAELLARKLQGFNLKTLREPFLVQKISQT